MEKEALKSGKYSLDEIEWNDERKTEGDFATFCGLLKKNLIPTKKLTIGSEKQKNIYLFIF